MHPNSTRVLRLTQSAGQLSRFSTAVSMHSHTQHSRESLEYLPMQARCIPIFGNFVGRKLREYESGCGKALDFRRAWWTPPLSPAQVYESERKQIDSLGLATVVSITDHDSIAAGLDLRRQTVAADAAISVEWTVPIAGDHLHLGVHNLPAGRAETIMEELARFTADSSTANLRDLLAMLAQSPDTLLVLNHPCWDVSRVGAAEHGRAVREFLSLGEPWVHALEVNGLRSWRENRDALALADELGMPTVAGGDRHGCRPNAVLNLTRAASFAEFAAEVRCDRQSEILILPSYEEPLALRQLQTVADAIRHYPHHPHGRRRFTSRTFVDIEGYSVHPLSFYWDGGEPWWLKPPLALIVALGSDTVKPILRYTVFRSLERDLMVKSPVFAESPAIRKEPLQSQEQT